MLQKGVSVLKPEEMDMVDVLFHPEIQEELKDDKNVKEQPTD